MIWWYDMNDLICTLCYPTNLSLMPMPMPMPIVKYMANISHDALVNCSFSIHSPQIRQAQLHNSVLQAFNCQLKMLVTNPCPFWWAKVLCAQNKASHIRCRKHCLLHFYISQPNNIDQQGAYNMNYKHFVLYYVFFMWYDMRWYRNIWNYIFF